MTQSIKTSHTRKSFFFSDFCWWCKCWNCKMMHHSYLLKVLPFDILKNILLKISSVSIQLNVCMEVRPKLHSAAFWVMKKKHCIFDKTCEESYHTYMWASALGVNFIPPHMITFLDSMETYRLINLIIVNPSEKTWRWGQLPMMYRVVSWALTCMHTSCGQVWKTLNI